MNNLSAFLNSEIARRKNKLATKIQKAYRGYKGRKEASVKRARKPSHSLHVLLGNKPNRGGYGIYTASKIPGNPRYKVKFSQNKQKYVHNRAPHRHPQPTREQLIKALTAHRSLMKMFSTRR